MCACACKNDAIYVRKYFMYATGVLYAKHIVYYYRSAELSIQLDSAWLDSIWLDLTWFISASTVIVVHIMYVYVYVYVVYMVIMHTL